MLPVFQFKEEYKNIRPEWLLIFFFKLKKDDNNILNITDKYLDINHEYLYFLLYCLKI